MFLFILREFKFIARKDKRSIKEWSIGQKSAFELLRSLIEGDPELEVRVKCVEILENIKLRREEVYKSLENLLISDSESWVRSEAAKVIARNFLDSGFDALKWSLGNDISPNCSIAIIETLKDVREVDENTIKSILLNLFRNLIEEDPIYSDNTYSWFKKLPFEEIAFSKLVKIFYNIKVAQFLDQNYCSKYMDNSFTPDSDGFITWLRLQNLEVNNMPLLKDLSI